MATVKRQRSRAQKPAATNLRSLRSFLLMAQFEAEEIGARIVEARLAAGLEQKDLAAMCSFSQRSLSDYERGVTIPYKHMRELGRLLKRSPEWFLYGDEAEETEVVERLDRIEQAQEKQVSLLRELASRLGRDDEATPS